MNDQKDLWEKLAKDNSKYYIYSSAGKKIGDCEFSDSGILDYQNLIEKDDLIPKRGTIIDLGCGTGRMTEWMPRDFDKVIGIDISAEMIKQGHDRLYDEPKISLMETDGRTIPLASESVDVVFSYIVFQHIKDKLMVEDNFREVHRVLKEDGIFKVLLRTDELENLNSWWSGVAYDDKTIKELCEMVGFKIIKKERVKDYAIWLWLKYEK